MCLSENHRNLVSAGRSPHHAIQNIVQLLLEISHKFEAVTNAQFLGYTPAREDFEETPRLSICLCAFATKTHRNCDLVAATLGQKQSSLGIGAGSSSPNIEDHTFRPAH
jgi:hypothetical protein